VGGLNQYVAQVAVASPGDAALATRGPAQVFAGDQAGEAHEAGRAREATEVADLCRDRHRRPEGDAAQDLKGSDQRQLRALLRASSELRLQPSDPLAGRLLHHP